MLSIAVAVLGLVAMACTCNMPKLGGVGPVPKATVPVSKEAAASMQKKLESWLKLQRFAEGWERSQALIIYLALIAAVLASGTAFVVEALTRDKAEIYETGGLALASLGGFHSHLLPEHWLRAVLRGGDVLRAERHRAVPVER